MSGNRIDIQPNHSHSLKVNNEDGLIQGHRLINLTAKGLEAEGKIKTAGDLSISLKESFTLNHAFEVGNNLTFNTEGDFENNVLQTAKNKATFTANHITNNANAEISATDTELNAKQLTNRGIIDGSNTLINSRYVTNLGTGRIYGDHLSFNSSQIDNLKETVNGETKSGTIAARKRLDFGVGTLTNRDHALILSLGDFVIGGRLDNNGNAIGQAKFIDNGSATIEVLGKGYVNTEKLLNHDLYLTLGTNTTKEQVEEIALESKPTERYRVGVDGHYGWSGRTSWFEFYDKTKPTLREKQFYVWNYTRVTHTPYIQKQDQAVINIGGDLHLDGDNLHNKYSKIAIGGKLFLGDQQFTSNENNASLTSHSGVTLNNEAIKKIVTVDEAGEAQFLEHYKEHGHNGHRHKHLDDFVKPTYEIAGNFDMDLNPIGSKLDSAAKVQNKISAQDVTLDTINIQPIKDKMAIGTVSANSPTLAKTQTTHIVLTPTIDDSEKNHIVDSGQVVAKLDSTVKNFDMKDFGKLELPTVKTHLTEVNLPTASLYRINPNHPNGYLVETDPRVTNRQEWLSSDYMFNQLRYDHNNTLKRLGDGFYEQRIISEQVNQLTGRRFIQGYQNDLEQYKALMDSGMKYAKQFNLAVGVGLTAKQMAELTTDMVWMVNKNITLPNGQTVTALTPQVYLVARNSDIISHGAVISANQIIGNVDNLKNTGIIAGRDLTQINSNQLENRGIILGDNVDLSAKQNLINLGGKIEAVNSLSLFAGKTLDISSTLSHSTSKDGNFERTVLDQIGSVKVTGKGGQLVLASDGNITMKGADIESNGTIRAEANAINITTLNTKNKEHYNGDADNYYRLDQKGEVGSQLIGQDGVTLVSQKDLTLRQAKVSSQNGDTILASRTGNINVETGHHEEQLATARKSTSKGLFSKTTSLYRYEHNDTTGIGSEIDGKNIKMIAQNGNVTIKGSTAVAEKDLTVFGKTGVAIVSDVATHFQQEASQTTKSGLMGVKGGLGFTIGKKKETTEEDNTKQSAVSSLVGGLNGNTTIVTEGHYQQTGSSVLSQKGDVDIVAKTATIERQGQTTKITINTPWSRKASQLR